MLTIGNVNHNSEFQHQGINLQIRNDPYSKNILNQIAGKQKELQNLSKSENMPLEEKMKKIQEIQKEITDLNNQLRQHQIEQRIKQQQKKSSSMDNKQDGTNNKHTNDKKNGSSISKAGMMTLISADSYIKQAKVQGSVATNLRGRIGVLESEIKSDKGRGANTEKKEAELADMQERLHNTINSQISTLANADKVMKEASKEEQTSKENEEKDTDNDKDTLTIEQNDSKNLDTDSYTETHDKKAATEKTNTASQQVNYTSVDISI